MVTLISVCMVFFCGLGDQPTGPKYEVWKGFFSYYAFGAYSRRITLFYFVHFVREHDRTNRHIGQRDKITERERKGGGSSKLNDVAKKLPAYTVQLKMTAAVVLSTRDQTSKSSYSTVYTHTRPIFPKLRLHCIH